MKYLFKNIHNPWVITFLLLFLFTLIAIFFLFRTIYRKPKDTEEEWESRFHKNLVLLRDNSELEQMQQTYSDEYENQRGYKNKLERMTRFIMLFSIFIFLITLVSLPFSIKRIPFIYIPGINNPAIIFIGLYIAILVILTISYMIASRFFYTVKEQDAGKIRYDGPDNEMTLRLKQCILEDAVHSQILIQANKKRKSYFLRASSCSFVSLILFLILIAGLTLSRYF